MFKRIIKNHRGAIFAEYALLATLIAIACLISVSVLGASVLNLFQSGGLLEVL